MAYDNSNFDWDKLKAFCKIVESGSINAAAAKMGIKQSSVSRQMSALEDQLGVPLIRRHARGVDLTEQGELLYNFAKEFSLKLSRTQSLIQESKTKPQGLIRVATTPWFGSMWLSAHVHEFMEQYPGIILNVHLTDQELDTTIQDMDCVLRFGPTNRLDLIQKVLFKARYILCTTQRYIDKHGVPKNLADLSNHQLIVYTDLLLTLGCPANEKRIPAFRINSVQGLLNAILNGVGIAALPSYVAYSHPEIVRILEHEHIPGPDCYFCYPTELRKSKKITVFREFLIEKTAKIF